MLSIYPAITEKSNLSANFKKHTAKKFTELLPIVAKYNWSPAHFKNDYRNKANFIGAIFIGLDFDNKHEQVMTLDQAVNNVFCDMRHIIGTTRNHQRWKGNESPRDRFRVILQMPTPLTTVEEYEYQLLQAHNRWGTDKYCIDAARYFKPCREIISNSDGYLWDIETEPPELVELRRIKYLVAEKEAKAYAAQDKLSPKILHWLHIQNSDAGDRNNTVFYLANELFRNYPYPKEQVIEIIKTSNTYKNNVNDSGFVHGAVATIESAYKSQRNAVCLKM